MDEFLNDLDRQYKAMLMNSSTLLHKIAIGFADPNLDKETLENMQGLLIDFTATVEKIKEVMEYREYLGMK